MSLSVQRESKVFISVEEALSAASRLNRLVTLESALSGGVGENRSRYIDNLIAIWKSFTQNPLTFSESQSNLIEKFQACSKSRISKLLPRLISDQMIDSIELANSMEELNLICKKVLKDCSTLSISPAPISKSSEGRYGPTLLVGYSNPLQEAKSWVAYVLKWTDKKETAGYMAYQSFLHLMQSDLRIPENCWYDFTTGIYLDSKRYLKYLDEKSTLELKNAFNSIPASLDPSIKIYGDQLLVLERVNGENFGEFARFKYKDLSENQKKDLFRSFGEIAILDLLLGNTDRLLMLGWGNEYIPKLDSSASMLGNLMFTRNEGDNYSIVLIDNSVDEEFLKSLDRRENYNRFLTEIFENEHPESVLASALLENLRSAFRCYPSDMSCSQGEAFNVRRIERELEPIMRDLEGEFAFSAIQEGMEKACVKLINLSFLWNSDQLDYLKDQLKVVYPEFLTALEERYPVLLRSSIVGDLTPETSKNSTMQ